MQSLRLARRATRLAMLERERVRAHYFLEQLEGLGGRLLELVERRDAPDDGRGYELVLTRSGRAMRRRMWPVYADQIEALFSRHLTLEEARAIGEALGRAVKAARAAS